MGIFGKREKQKTKYITEQFKVINGYTPVFTSYEGGLYEMELTRSAINSIALHASKLTPVVKGNYRHEYLNKMLKTKPNYIMTTQQFLMKLFTILICENNAFIIPIYKDMTATDIVGFYPIRSVGTEILSYEGELYLKYKLGSEYQYIEYDRVGHLKNHFYKKDYLGESNFALNTTMDLMDTQNQGIKHGIKNSAGVRFLARLTNIITPDHLKKEREELTKANLSMDNNGGVMIFDNKYSEVKEINSTPFIIDDKQVEHIKSNVFNYFHISEAIIQNKASEDEYNAFYEGLIEPLAIQLSQVFTNMLMTSKDIQSGYEVMFESSRLQFASNKTKIDFVTLFVDRGLITTNQGLAVFNLPPVEGGDKRYIRKEYTEVNNLDKEGSEDGKDGKESEE